MRTLVLLLVGLPLLMPPGMCICQFVPCGTAAASQLPSPQPATFTESSARPGDGCCCKKRQKDSPPDREGRQTAGQSPEKSPAEGEPCRTPGKHMPGCPAAVSAVEARFVLPPVPVPLDTDFSPLPFAFLVSPFAPAAPAASHPIRHLAAPILIAHCTLLI